MKKLFIIIMILVSLASANAAEGIEFIATPGLANLYFRVYRQSDGFVWDTTGSPAFESFVDGQVANYDIVLTEQGTSGYYTGSLSGIDEAYITAVAYNNGTPAITDTPIGASDAIAWDGTVIQKIIDTDGNTSADIILVSSSATAANNIEEAFDDDGIVSGAFEVDRIIIDNSSDNDGHALDIRGVNSPYYSIHIQKGQNDTSILCTGNVVIETFSLDQFSIGAGDEDLDDFVWDAGTRELTALTDAQVANDLTIDDVTTLLTRLGTPVNIDAGGATIADNIKTLADDNGGADFNAAQDSLNVIRTRGDTAWLTGAGATASETYNITSITRTIGDNDGGDDGDVDIVDGVYFSTGEINGDPSLTVDAVFTANDPDENPIAVIVWAFYNGGPSHHMDVLAETSDGFEKIGEIANGTIIQMLSFALTPQHITAGTGVISIKFDHDPSASTQIGHVYSIDKIIVTTAVSSITATNIDLILADTTKIPKSDGNVSWNSTALGAIEAEAIDALESFKLDELMSEAVTTNLNTAVHDNSVIGYMISSSDVAQYDRTTDSLEDIRDRGDAAWDTATGFSTPTNITDAHSTTDSKIDTTDTLITSSHTTTDTLIIALHAATDSKIDTTDSLITSKHSTTDTLIDDSHTTTDTLIIASHSTTDGLIGALNDFDSTSDPVEILASGGTAGKNAEELVDDFWDETINKSTHSTNSSAGKLLRHSNISITTDDVASSTSNTITLGSSASSTDGAYDPALIFIRSGLGAGQSRNILEYKGSTKTAVVDRNWKVNPDDTSEYCIMADAGRNHVNEGLAQQGDSTTIRLNALASSANNAYKNQYVFIRSGIGEDQVRRIVSYNGTTKDATVSRDWDVNPDSTSGYIIMPFACVDVQALSGTELTDKAGENFDTFFDDSGNTATTEVSDIDLLGTTTNQTTIINHLTGIKGGGWITLYSLEGIYDWLEADEIIDLTNPAQFQKLRTLKNSGGGGATLGLKDINDSSGNPVTDLTTPMLQNVEP